MTTSTSFHPLTIIESPYSGATDADVQRHITYARLAVAHSISLGETPFASHLFYTQVLDDATPGQRALGISLGFHYYRFAEKAVVYHDLGLSPGMKAGIDYANRLGLRVLYRYLPDDILAKLNTPTPITHIDITKKSTSA